MRQGLLAPLKSVYHQDKPKWIRIKYHVKQAQGGVGGGGERRHQIICDSFMLCKTMHAGEHRHGCMDREQWEKCQRHKFLTPIIPCVRWCQWALPRPHIPITHVRVTVRWGVRCKTSLQTMQIQTKSLGWVRFLHRLKNFPSSSGQPEIFHTAEKKSNS